MSEGDAIARASGPVTVESLMRDLRALGLQMGDTVMAHTSLSAIGWVNGGAAAVIHALLATLGDAGTLVLPTHSADLSDPAEWSSPPVPERWHRTIRDTMPPYDPLRTPTRDMGRVPELFRTWPGVLRSAHPAQSLAASGPLARHIVDPHPYDDPFGEASPLGRLYDLDARTLLIGVGYDTCTILHLAERRALPDLLSGTAGAPVMIDGERKWISYRMPTADADQFPQMAEVLDELPSTRKGNIGHAPSRLLSARDSVESATKWMRST